MQLQAMRKKIPFKQRFSERTPACLLGGLTLIRPLGYGDIQVIVATSDSSNPALASRYCDGYVAITGSPQDKCFIEDLINAGRQLADLAGQRIPLFYGTDDDIRFLYRHEQELNRYFTMLLNGRELGLALLDKEQFDRLAQERGLRVPRIYCWDGLDGPALEDAPGPVIIKPNAKTQWKESPINRDLFCERGKALIFSSARELMAHSPARKLKDLLIVQDYIPGEDFEIFSFHGYADDHSRLLAWFVGRKIRTYPRYTGESSYLELLADAKDLEATGLDIMMRLGLKGAFKMDFKRNQIDGHYYLLEINARFNLWHQLGAMNGVNLPLVAYDYLVHGNRAVHPTVTCPRYRWLNFNLDYHAYRDAAALGEMSLWTWLVSLLGSHKAYRLFSLSDPMPFLSRFLPFHMRRGTLWHPTVS